VFEADVPRLHPALPRQSAPAVMRAVPVCCPNGGGPDAALDGIRKIAIALDDAFFSSRLRAKTMRFGWLPDDYRATGSCWPEQREIAFRRDTIEGPFRRPLIALITHELCHAWTGAEVDHHGERWARAMRQRGVCPATTLIVPGGPTDIWLRMRGL
jgi:hypothetical protein